MGLSRIEARRREEVSSGLSSGDILGPYCDWASGPIRIYFDVIFLYISFFPSLLSFFPPPPYFVSETKVVVENVNADEVSSSPWLSNPLQFNFLTIDMLLTARGSFSSCCADCFFADTNSRRNFVISKFRSIHRFKP